MSTVTINNSPIHSDSSLSAVYGETGPNWARFHTGIDFIPHGSTPSNPDIFSVCSGTVVQVSNSTTLWHGNMVLILDPVTNKYWRYCHMVNGSITVSVGQQVTTTTKLGVMGATGNVTGVHLHLECSTTPVWNYDTFVNPAVQLGIPNVRGTIVLYDGTTPPTPPTPPTPSGKLSNSQKWLFCKSIKIRRL